MDEVDVSEQLASKLQSLVRGYLARQRFRLQVREAVQNELSCFDDLDKTGKTILPVADIIRHGKWLIKYIDLTQDAEILTSYCRLLILSMDSPKETNFATIFLAKDTIASGNKLISTIIGYVPRLLSEISGSKVSEVKRWQTLIHFLIIFSSANSWSLVRGVPQVQVILNGLCQKMNTELYTDGNYTRLANSIFLACNDHRPLISVEALNALFSVVFRPLREGGANHLLPLFITRVLTCPALVLHLSQKTTESVLSSGIFGRVLTCMRDEPELLERMEPKRTINLMGNVIQLGYLDEETTKQRIIDWTWFLGVAMAQCTEFAVRPGEKSSHNHWHPIFGHYRLPIDTKTEGSLKVVVRQLKLLWSSRIVSGLFGLALAGVESTKQGAHDSSKDLGVAFSKLWKRLGGGNLSEADSHAAEAMPTLTAIVCNLYVSAMSSMQHLKSGIISGICHKDQILRQLWAYLVRWGSVAASVDQSPLTSALRIVTRPNSPHAAPLQLFAEAAASVISILDEEEMYEKGVPFALTDLVRIAKFCNWFCFRAIWTGLTTAEGCEGTLFGSIHHLLLVLYSRDCRHRFISDAKFWLSPDVKSPAIISEFEKKTARGLLLIEKLSHCVLLRERMLLFRKFIGDEKCAIAAPAALITVVRNRIVEDGYRQLSLLSPRTLKNTIRVKFVNEQGLEEAGIDQDGVFKEFLELTMKQVFTPSLNLFASTSSGVLYPSATSYFQQDHLALFHFVGRMLGKAVFEGIVVDVQLAPVLLAAVLGDRRLCAFDELAQLDPELYKNLTFVKRYEGDIEDLALTFSTDDDYLGKVVTTDLIPGGRTVQVTNENKIDYVHRMAHHRVFGETKQQCKSFVSGFQSIINSQWLSLFAPHEIQFLISGQNCDIDVADMKRHVQYYGGFHGSHRLIKWLWDIIQNEFTIEERRLFLKFVTSCSKPPVLGFSFLEPPFSIRCVEVSDDQDQGDTLGSVVRGFLALRKSHSVTRLPTASTCFNLLKLPNYSKKSVLLAKLRYAIHAESGFELS